MQATTAEEARVPFRLALAKISADFDRAALEATVQELLLLGVHLDIAHFPPAQPGQELLYPLVENDRGPSLYVVSDGAGTSSPPHEHLTWGLIVGLSGQELNTFYERRTPSSKEALRTSERSIGPGEFLVLEPSAIHSTSVVGSSPTYHLHLYGRALSSLPSFGARQFQSGA